MPIISHFFGIVVRMYFNDDEQRHVPHFHVKYGEYEASSALWDIMQTEDQYFKIKGLE